MELRTKKHTQGNLLRGPYSRGERNGTRTETSDADDRVQKRTVIRELVIKYLLTYLRSSLLKSTKREKKKRFSFYCRLCVGSQMVLSLSVITPFNITRVYRQTPGSVVTKTVNFNKQDPKKVTVSRGRGQNELKYSFVKSSSTYRCLHVLIESGRRLLNIQCLLFLSENSSGL